MSAAATKKEPEITEALAKEHGLSPDEFRRVHDILGRAPSYTELGIFSVMWSEHCSYKSSRLHLRNLPTSGPRVIQGPGENAGVVDIGDGQAVIFKMESHNHPSFIEPYQGAATGVGGILRDVFTMGARPVACLDSLRFGRPDHPKTRHLVEGVVAGIAGYGNAFGVPTVGGEVYFDASYDGNILVNAMAVGLARTDKIFYGKAKGLGNPVLYFGAKTGRDGIHGATMASAEFDEESESKRPTVQVGDPFTEKLLLEACLELMSSDVLVGIQDMGAAGLTSSSVEMAARAGNGIELDLDKVPRRETNMTAYECMLSESQERMLAVVHAGREAEALAIFAKWDLDAAVVGRVTDTGKIVVKEGGKVRAEIAVGPLAEGLRYERPFARPASLDAERALDVAKLPVPKDLGVTLTTLLASPNIASKEWVYRQYDHMVRVGTVVRPGADAAVIRVLDGAEDPARAKGLALTADCNSRFCALDPYEGARLAVAEGYRNISTVGAEPLAITDCLNFGNPERPEVMWQLVEAVRGLGDACRALETPVVSGNVSLYNETEGRAIKPTPTIGTVGLMPIAADAVGVGFEEGCTVALLGVNTDEIGGSEYLDRVHGKQAGVPPRLDTTREVAVGTACRNLVQAKLVRSAHDCSEGGLAVTLAESCIQPARAGAASVGVTIKLDEPLRADLLLFGEAPSRIVISFPPEREAEVRAMAVRYGAPFEVIGATGGRRLQIYQQSTRVVDVPVDELTRAWQGGFRAVVS
ncbi:MAG: Phosphoribosylformylglycinamidine synthase, synthetase subunit [Myxococcales bacterium]|nr:Phosphoribosylformylglycinamidine synthase, synthetase subunit [Myxococcales bacterium]